MQMLLDSPRLPTAPHCFPLPPTGHTFRFVFSHLLLFPLCHTQMLKELGAKRTIQMPGTGIWTMPGYNFHFTVSIGLNVAESCNMFLEVLGWTFEKLWKVSGQQGSMWGGSIGSSSFKGWLERITGNTLVKMHTWPYCISFVHPMRPHTALMRPMQARPLEQYPEPADDVARYMKETGILARLGVSDRGMRRQAGGERGWSMREAGWGAVHGAWFHVGHKAQTIGIKCTCVLPLSGYSVCTPIKHVCPPACPAGPRVCPPATCLSAPLLALCHHLWDSHRATGHLTKPMRNCR